MVNERTKTVREIGTMDDALVSAITNDPNRAYRASVEIVPTQATRDLEQPFEIRPRSGTDPAAQRDLCTAANATMNAGRRFHALGD